MPVVVMENVFLKAERYICHSCRHVLRRDYLRRSYELRLGVTSGRRNNLRSYSTPLPADHEIKKKHQSVSPPLKSSDKPSSTVNSEDLVQQTLNQKPVPDDTQVLEALRTLEDNALKLSGYRDPNFRGGEAANTATSAMLSLNDRLRSRPTSTQAHKNSNQKTERISALAYRLLKDPRVFIAPEALDVYVTIQTLLSKPQSFPEVFNLYATKAQPQVSKSKTQEISYEAPRKDAASSAVATHVANLAIDAAIQIRNLPLALAILAESFQTPAFRRSKFVKKALPPLIGVAGTPLAAWIVASNLSEVQTGLPQETFTQIAFAGIATYAAAVGTIGYVALTSANDQMRRVTWAVGMPLRERWMREEERAALDRIACAWGFREKWRWGEEEGQDWEDLREWIGLRGMVLDKVGLMEGME